MEFCPKVFNGLYVFKEGIITKSSIEEENDYL